jgi:hypothetical protein
MEDDDDGIYLPPWMEEKEDEKLEHYSRLVDPPSPAQQLGGLVYSILGPKP